MSDEAECEFARSSAPGASGAAARGTEREHRGGGRPVGETLRETLRTADGVRIEAAYDPYAGPAVTGDDGTAVRGLPQGPCAIVVAHGFSGSLDRPALRRAARVFTQYGAVITFSFRGHGNSGGHSTVGDREVLDLAEAVSWARSLGHERVATVGFSMGGSVVVRHGALHRRDGREGYLGERPGSDAQHTEAHERRTGAHPGTAAQPLEDFPGDATQPYARTHSDAVVAVSAPARWYYRGTAPMRRVHWVIQRPVGRLVSRYGLRTRIHPHDWDPVPLSPVGAAPALAPTPLLVVHGDQDPYFPLDHPQSLAGAGHPASTDLWIVPGFGHAENAAGPGLLHRIGQWVDARWERAAGGPA
ncbi:alpha/beta hydrolase [Streptomyces ovatisporus]|uniref:Alpha/beta hydrolase n=1 Tax=Streptomyces ovatisporus TaxID=1128682 RepID=A0ABV9A6X0_9ACTN